MKGSLKTVTFINLVFSSTTETTDSNKYREEGILCYCHCSNFSRNSRQLRCMTIEVNFKFVKRKSLKTVGQ